MTLSCQEVSHAWARPILEDEIIRECVGTGKDDDQIAFQLIFQPGDEALKTYRTRALDGWMEVAVCGVRVIGPFGEMIISVH